MRLIRIIILKLLGTLCRVTEKFMEAQIQKKADGWKVLDEKGSHMFATEAEAKAYAGGKVAAEEPEAEAEEE